jgi:hypothetical protein
MTVAGNMRWFRRQTIRAAIALAVFALYSLLIALLAIGLIYLNKTIDLPRWLQSMAKDRDTLLMVSVLVVTPGYLALMLAMKRYLRRK